MSNIHESTCAPRTGSRRTPARHRHRSAASPAASSCSAATPASWAAARSWLFPSTSVQAHHLYISNVRLTRINGTTRARGWRARDVRGRAGRRSGRQARRDGAHRARSRRRDRRRDRLSLRLTYIHHDEYMHTGSNGSQQSREMCQEKGDGTHCARGARQRCTRSPACCLAGISQSGAARRSGWAAAAQQSRARSIAAGTPATHYAGRVAWAGRIPTGASSPRRSPTPAQGQYCYHNAFNTTEISVTSSLALHTHAKRRTATAHTR